MHSITQFPIASTSVMSCVAALILNVYMCINIYTEPYNSSLLVEIKVLHNNSTVQISISIHGLLKHTSPKHTFLCTTGFLFPWVRCGRHQTTFDIDLYLYHGLYVKNKYKRAQHKSTTSQASEYHNQEIVYSDQYQQSNLRSYKAINSQWCDLENSITPIYIGVDSSGNNI